MTHPLLTQLRREGIYLRAVRGAIRWRPKDAPGVAERLRAEKPDVLGALRAELPRTDPSGALLAAGYPPTLLALDFESHQDEECSLARLEVVRYVAHPRFRVHGLAVATANADTGDITAEFSRDPARLLRALADRLGPRLDQATVVMHNARFDAYLLQRLYGLSPRFLLCTRSLYYGLGGRRRQGEGTLAALAQAYGLGTKGDIPPCLDVEQLSEEQTAALTEYAEKDARLTLSLARELLPRIRWPEVELPLITHTVRLFSERAFAFDIAGARHLLREVEEDDERVLDEAGLDESHTAHTVQRRLVLALARVGRAMPTKAGKDGPVPALAKDDPEAAALLSDPDPRVAALARALRHLGSSHPTRSRLDTMLALAKAHVAGLPVDLAYCGAHTGRFTGQGGFNWQNLPSREEGPAARVRGLLHARGGHLLVVADAAQIESRLTAWLAGERQLLDAYAQGRDPYSEFAARLFGDEVRKPREDDPPERARRLTALRAVGKEAVLALGFGMGPAMFWARLRSTPALRPLIESGELSASRARGIVHCFRRTYPRIPILWRRLERELGACIRAGHALGGFRWEGPDVLLMLPSGRAVRYEEPRIARGRSGRPSIVAGRQGSEHLYGGLLTENLVQATARDLLALAILGLEAQGCRVVLHVHDELVLEVRAKDAASASQAARSALEHDPGWWPELGPLPLRAEVYVAPNYSKEQA